MNKLKNETYIASSTVLQVPHASHGDVPAFLIGHELAELCSLPPGSAFSATTSPHRMLESIVQNYNLFFV